MTRADMDRVRDDFVRAARRGRRMRVRLARAPLRARLPAVGVHLPADQPPRRRVRRVAREPLPLSARSLSRAARRLAAASARCRCASPRTTGRRAATRRTTPSRSRGCSRPRAPTSIDVSSGQTTRDASPSTAACTRRRSPTAFATRSDIATMAVGAIFEPDHVNSILMAGRADLCALARPHLADPYWTLHAAAQLGYRDMPWPPQYLPGGAARAQPRARRAAAPANVPEAQRMSDDRVPADAPRRDPRVAAARRSPRCAAPVAAPADLHDD